MNDIDFDQPAAKNKKAPAPEDSVTQSAMGDPKLEVKDESQVVGAFEFEDGVQPKMVYIS